MAVRALALNAEGAFGDPKHWQTAVEFVETQQPDVAFLGESHWEEPLRSRGETAVAKNETVLQESVLALRSLGYHILRSSDNDASHTRPDRTGFLGLVRGGPGQSTVITMGTRSAYSATVTDPETGLTGHFVGQHYDDKDERTRMGHVRDLPADADVLMGDLNNLHRTDRVAHLLRLFAPAAALIPAWEYDFTHAEPNLSNRLKTILHLAKRSVGMAAGGPLQAITERGLTDADPAHQPTIARGPLQLDRFMVGSRVAVQDFTVHTDTTFSDHYPISAILRIEQPRTPVLPTRR